MRIYLPSTLVGLSSLLAEGRLPGGAAFAVTPALREWYASGDDEELEYAALSRAARISLDLLGDEVTAPRRRVVVVAEVPDGEVTGQSDDDPSAVQVVGDVALRSVQAVHVDDESAVPQVRAALIDPDDEDAAGDLEDHELLWYATQEIDQLVG